METMEMNVIPFVAYALAYHPRASKYIEEIYKNNKAEAYTLSKESELYNTRLFYCGSLEQEIKCKMALGVILLAIENEQINKEFFQIIKKCWKWLIDLEEKGEMVSEIDFFKNINPENPTIITSMCFMAMMIGVEVDFGDTTQDNNAKMYLRYVVGDDPYKYDFSKLGSKQKENVVKARDDFFKGRNNIPRSYRDLMHYLYLNCLSSNEFITGLAESEDIELMDVIEGIDLSNRDLNDVFAFIDMHKNIQSDRGFMFATGFYIKSLSKAYMKVKKEYFKHHKDTLLLQQQSIEYRLKTIQEERNSFLAEIKRIKGEYKESIEKENLELKRKIEKLKEALEESKANDEELFKLREYIFETKEYEEDLDLKEDFEIPDIKVIVIGGNESWVSRIKEELPSSFEFVSGFKENFDLKVLENAELVLFVTNSMAHSTYYRAKKGIKCPFEYISQGNVKLFKQSLKKLLERGN